MHIRLRGPVGRQATTTGFAGINRTGRPEALLFPQRLWRSSTPNGMNICLEEIPVMKKTLLILLSFVLLLSGCTMTISNSKDAKIEEKFVGVVLTKQDLRNTAGLSENSPVYGHHSHDENNNPCVSFLDNDEHSIDSINFYFYFINNNGQYGFVQAINPEIRDTGSLDYALYSGADFFSATEVEHTYTLSGEINSKLFSDVDKLYVNYVYETDDCQVLIKSADVVDFTKGISKTEGNTTINLAFVNT